MARKGKLLHLSHLAGIERLFNYKLNTPVINFNIKVSSSVTDNNKVKKSAEAFWLPALVNINYL